MDGKGRNSAATSVSTTAVGPTHRLTGKPPIRPISTRWRQKWRQRNRGGKPLRKCPEPVQKNLTSSLLLGAVSHALFGEIPSMAPGVRLIGLFIRHIGMDDWPI